MSTQPTGLSVTVHLALGSLKQFLDFPEAGSNEQHTWIACTARLSTSCSLTACFHFLQLPEAGRGWRRPPGGLAGCLIRLLQVRQGGALGPRVPGAAARWHGESSTLQLLLCVPRVSSKSWELLPDSSATPAGCVACCLPHGASRQGLVSGPVARQQSEHCTLSCLFDVKQQGGKRSAVRMAQQLHCVLSVSQRSSEKCEMRPGGTVHHACCIACLSLCQLSR